jgi:hypothetical protein
MGTPDWSMLLYLCDILEKPDRPYNKKKLQHKKDAEGKGKY